MVGAWAIDQRLKGKDINGASVQQDSMVDVLLDKNDIKTKFGIDIKANHACLRCITYRSRSGRMVCDPLCAASCSARENAKVSYR